MGAKRRLEEVKIATDKKTKTMCQLLGLNCNHPTDVTFSFSGFAMRGGITDQHQDGWGIAFFEGTEEDRGLRHFVDHLPASSAYSGAT